MSSLVDIILSLLRAGREYLRDMSKAPLQKIEETLDIATLIWMLLYGSFPYPTAQRQIEELISEVEEEIEGRTEEAKEGFVWVYRISYLWRILTLDVAWIDDYLTYKIANRQISTLREDIKIEDVLSYRTPNQYISRMLESVKVTDIIERLITSTKNVREIDEYIHFIDEFIKCISQLSISILDETVTISDALSTWIGTTSPTTFSETLTLTDELIPQTLTALTYTFSETIKITEGKTEGYPYPELPEKILWRHELGDSVFVNDYLNVEATAVTVFLTLYHGLSTRIRLYNVNTVKYHGLSASQKLYNCNIIKYNGLTSSSVTIQ